MSALADAGETHNLIRSPDSLLEFPMSRLAPLKPGADQGISSDWEPVEHEWSILAMVAFDQSSAWTGTFGSPTPETVEGPHHAILMNFAIGSRQVEEVVQDC
jgi:hypothetical protein